METKGFFACLDAWHSKSQAEIIAIIKTVLFDFKIKTLNFYKQEFLQEQTDKKIVNSVMLIWIFNKSYISIHINPKQKFVTIDCYAFGRNSPLAIIKQIKEKIKPHKSYEKNFFRGDIWANLNIKKNESQQNKRWGYRG